MNSTNFPSNGTTSDVGGMISANKRKNTVNDKRMDMLSDTCNGRRVVRRYIIDLLIKLARECSTNSIFLFMESHEGDKSKVSEEIESSRNFFSLFLGDEHFALIKRCFHR